MSKDQMRAEFEAWYLKKYYEGDSACGERWLAKSSCGGYLYAQPSEHWSVWQASHAVLVIDLPDANAYDMPGLAQQAIEDCRAAIEAAGITVRQP